MVRGGERYVSSMHHQDLLWQHPPRVLHVTWLLDCDFGSPRHLLSQLVPGMIGTEQPLLHVAVVAAAVADLGPLDGKAEKPARGRPLKLQPPPQALLLSVGAVLKGRAVGGLQDELAIGIRGLVDIPQHSKVRVRAGLGFHGAVQRDGPVLHQGDAPL